MPVLMRKAVAAPCALVAGLWLAGCQGSPQSTTSTSAAPQPAAPSDGASRKAPATDYEQLAERLVGQSAGVKEGELVFISGGTQDQELLENIAVNVRKLGAFPLLALNSDRLTRRMFFDVPEKLDTQTDALTLKVAENFNVFIAVNSNLDEGVLAGSDPKRQAARAKAFEPIFELILKRKIRQIEVGNGLYPTDWRAKRFGMTTDQLTKTFWEGVNVDYSSLAARADEIKGVLASGSEVQIRDANGTDLRVRVKGRPVHASDGVISAAEAAQGGAGSSVYLPAGEVFTTPVPGTAEGKLVRPREYFEGKEIQNLTLTFAGGKLMSMTGSGPGFEPMKAVYDAAGEGKDVFAVVDLGINPNITLPATSTLGTWVPAGTITVGIGNNVWAGGDNKAPYGYFVSMPGATVTLDGKPIIENGQLKI
jgi:leucyl aminopeptidase (aminopeptidase T)